MPEYVASARVPQTCWNCLLGKSERSTIAITNRGVYREDVKKSTCNKEEISCSFLPYSALQGVYWSNFQGQTSFPCISCCCAGCCACDSAQDKLHGHNGTRVYLSVKGVPGLSFGVQLPARYYGVGDESINRLIDSLNFAMLDRIPAPAMLDRIPSSENIGHVMNRDPVVKSVFDNLLNIGGMLFKNDESNKVAIPSEDEHTSTNTCCYTI